LKERRASQGSALVFDYGRRRIGVATASRISATASPLTTLPARDGVPDWATLDRLVREWEPGCLVVGIPYTDRPAGENAAADSERDAGNFAAQLQLRYELPVSRVDERLTSREAEDRLRDQRRSGTRRRRVRAADIDAMAACVIAENWIGGAGDAPEH
jgi:putative Holliday junction resolvase